MCTAMLLVIHSSALPTDYKGRFHSFQSPIAAATAHRFGTGRAPTEFGGFGIGATVITNSVILHPSALEQKSVRKSSA